MSFSVLTGYRPVQPDPFLASNAALPPPLSDRMRKRRAFADKELETIMLEREYKEREVLESNQAAAGPLRFPAGLVHHAAAAEFSAYKAGFSPPQVEHQPKDLCGFLGSGCLDLPAPYPSSAANVELISSNVSVATTYRHYPLQPLRGANTGGGGGFVMWPRGAANLGDALLYQQCLFNATAVQNMKPGAVWEPKVMPTESQPPAQEAAAGLAAKLEGSRAAALLDPKPPSASQMKECSAFSPPKRSFGHSFPSNSHSHNLKLSKDGAKLSMKLDSFHSLVQNSLAEKPGGPDLRAPYCRELLQEAARKFREGNGKDVSTKPTGNKMASGESLSFSVEAILKRPAPAVSRAFH